MSDQKERMVPADRSNWNAILKWSMAQQGDGTSSEPAREISEEDRRWLLDAMASGFIDEIKRMKDIIACISAGIEATHDAEEIDARVELKPATAAARSGSTLTPAMLAALTHEMLSEIVNAAAQIGIGTGATVNRTNGLDPAPPGEPAERRSDKPLLEPKDYGGVVTLAAFKAFMSARAHDERRPQREARRVAVAAQPGRPRRAARHAQGREARPRDEGAA